MTSAESLVYYPQYCFHLSPTINKWCPLRATDIVGLEYQPGFRGQDVFFSLNHPIRWVRVTGVVVAIDDRSTEYTERHIYTIDDSTGVCIECCLATSKPAQLGRPNGLNGGITSGAKKDSTSRTADKIAASDVPKKPPLEVPTDIDIGMVIEVRGTIELYRDQKQIKLLKLQRVRSTTQEVQFWNKIRDFRRDVLSRPWVLEKSEVRRCEKLEQAEGFAAERRTRKKYKKRDEGSAEDRRHGRKPANSVGRTTAKPAKAERAVRSESTKTYVEGQYDALGL